MKKLKYVEIIGIIITLILGVLLHFTFEWSGGNNLVALFSPVNESTWEHMKLLFFPYMLYAIFEYYYIGESYPNLITAKCIGVIIGLILIPVLFYGYTSLLGTNYFILDITVFILSVIISYTVSYYLLMNTTFKINGISLFLILLITAAFFCFTFYPPENILFLDPITQNYGK